MNHRQFLELALTLLFFILIGSFIFRTIDKGKALKSTKYAFYSTLLFFWDSYNSIRHSIICKLAGRLFLYTLVCIIVMGMLGSMVNAVCNYEAFKFQWGFIRRVDTGLLDSYKQIRNMFIYIGAIAGAVSALSITKKEQTF